MLAKSPTSARSDDQLQNEMMGTLGIHVAQSAKIIFNVKNLLYQLVKINVSPSTPLRKYDNVAAIVAGSKRNLDDLRRVQSMLKGYIYTANAANEQNNNQNIQTQSELIQSQNASSKRSSRKNSENGKNGFHKIKQQNLTNEGLVKNTDLNLNLQQKLINTKIENQQHEQTKFDTQTSKSKFEPSQKFWRAQHSKKQQVANFNPSQLQLETKISEPNKQTVENEQQQQLEIQVQNPKIQKIKHCKSAIIQTSKNLHAIRNRNKQCLQLISIIKKQIGLQLTDKFEKSGTQK